MIESVELNNFISYKSNTIKLDGGITALIGSNGAGKSSILDAVIADRRLFANLYDLLSFSKNTSGSKISTILIPLRNILSP